MLKPALFAVVLGVASSSLISAQARGAVPSLADFAAATDIRDVRLSPSGTKLMIVRLGSDGRYFGEIRNVADIANGGLSFDAAPAEIRGGVWLTDDLLLVQLRERRKRGSGSQWFQFNALFNAKGELIGKLPAEMPEVLGRDATTPTVLYLAYDSTGDGSPDVHRFDALTGKSERILRGSNKRFGFLVDRNGAVRISMTFDPGSLEVTYHARAANGDSWDAINVYRPKERQTFQPVGFLTEDPDELVVIANNGRDKAGVHIFSLSAKKIVRTLYQRDDVDIDEVIRNRQGRVVGARYATDMPRIEWLDPQAKAIAERAAPLLPDRSLSVLDISSNGYALVRSSAATDLGSWYLAKPDGSFKALGSIKPEFKGKQLGIATMRTIKARDGLPIPLFVTKPAGVSGPAPLVVMPHGGPWARDVGGFDDWAQFLAAQGYVVAQPQFRGSTGFGNAHWRAGDGQWGSTMQDDLDDTAKALIASKEVDPKRVAMFGWSYGGYAALVAGFRGNGLYRCTIAGAAVSDLNRIQALLSDNPVSSLVQKPTIVGPSPVNRLKDANIPVFIVHGDEDTVVDVSHGRDAAAALKAAGKPYAYVEIKGLDHTSDRFNVAQRTQFFTTLAGWLSSKECLGPAAR
jgi:dienelactone hydrolase